jgi:uncharacterized protein (DUF362 family)
MRWLALQLGALLGAKTLAACAPRSAVSPDIPPSTSESTTPPPSSPMPQASMARPTHTSETSELPELVVSRNGEPGELVRAALNAFGGMQTFVKAGDDVLIKPNICVANRTYEYAATTNPWVVGALVEMALQAGAHSVRVLDYPFGGSCEDAYIVSGIQEQVLAAGGEMEQISAFKFVETDLPQGIDLTKLRIYQDILDADVVINAPIAKHHSLAQLTLGMKNLMGTIQHRPPMHQNLGQRLADLASRIRPSLTVIDAVRILVRNGPTGGNLEDVRKIDMLIASPDIVAADSCMATLLGWDPMKLSYIAAGSAMGLGRSDVANLRLAEIDLSA